MKQVNINGKPFQAQKKRPSTYLSREVFWDLANIQKSRKPLCHDQASHIDQTGKKHQTPRYGMRANI